MPDSYADLVARLAVTRAAQAAEQAELDAWYEAQCAAARTAVARADQQAAKAGERVAKAQAAVDFTDAEAARIWLVLGSRMRIRDLSRLGPAPGAETEPDDSTPSAHPAHLLDHARELLDEVTPVTVGRPAIQLLVGLGLLLVVALVAAVVLRH
jgi:hypothetical protein